MKMKFCYELDPVGKMYMNSGAIVDAKKYNIGYSIYLGRLLFIISDKGINESLKIIDKLEKGILTCYEAGTETMDYYMYKNKVDFIDWFGDYDDWSCTIEEFTKALLGKKKFLEMPRDINSYLEVEINDLQNTLEYKNSIIQVQIRKGSITLEEKAGYFISSGINY